ncbi:MAG: N-acetylmuramoyl-L-alanine amidase [Anaerolineae bacterium]|nr:N-acetylmuramoyl-L-alanine amidase [Anaerolineae bacterium]
MTDHLDDNQHDADHEIELPSAETPADSPAEIPTVVPDAHIAPEFTPDMIVEAEPSQPAQPKPKAKPRPKQIAPQFIEEDTPPRKPSRPVRTARDEAEALRKERSKSRNARSRARAVPQKPSVPRFTFVTIVSTFRSITVTFAAAVIVATIFMWWTSPDFLPSRTRNQLAPVQATARPVLATRTPVPTPIWFNRIGIIAGHYGNDSGTVCPDNYTEAEVTLAVSQKLVAMLRGKGFNVDLLEEFDDRLAGYQAAAIISLHADSCDPEFGSGFKNAYPILREAIREQDIRLDECVKTNYAAITNLEFLPNQITPAMTEYHAWRQIAQTTPANILELGLMAADRQLLEKNQDLLATAIYNGIMCFLEPKALATQVAATQIVATDIATEPVVPTATSATQP